MNLPNKLSIARIALVPIMMFFYLADFIPYGKLVALVLFILAAATDGLDGSLARKRNEVTSLGKLLDPIADKMLMTIGFLLVVADGTILMPYGIIAFTILFFRDSLVNALRQYGTTKGIVFAAPWSGKIKAIFIYIAIPMFMALAFLNAPENFIPSEVTPYFEIACLVVLGISTLVTIWSAIDYSIKNAKLFKDRREQEEADKKS